MTEPLVRTTVTQRAIDQLKQKIASGELRPGQRLPTERDLAAGLGLSRSSMREAIRALTTLGVLESRHGAGVYVTSLEPGDLLETFGFLTEMSRGSSLVDLLQIRRILEPAAAATAAARRTDADLAAIEAHLTAMERAAEVEEFVTADLAFHRAVVAAAGNPALSAVVEGLSTPTFRARVWRGRRDAGAIPRMHEEHRRIFGALAARDPEAARAAAGVHIGEVEGWLRANLDVAP
ncbi:FadR/GntR family transcriptional regulator [Actinomadura kijaniata]|uniref:DNA-binding FadR family transcriptional regulator n=1 Tax=Actinomadura namibiensis TaxID=182080 RepID=A0A7W3LZS0_ACTNM|nr:FadR/GntR family transcriptional regulator [Actinomadura namibiensis]MBA8957202.1 DNA-binding FadR family transcriptional regulator [Actinomadura namibiensis]